MTEPRTRFTIAGAGLAGGLLANYLGRRGYPTAVYEHRGDIRTAGAVRGRSINLAISVRGLRALNEVGLADRVLEMAVPMRGRMIHSVNGDLAFQPYGKNEGDVINSVSRGQLNKILLEAAEKLDGVRLAFDERVTDVDLETGAVALENTATGERSRAAGDVVVGADGAFSAVRRRLLGNDRFDYSQSYLKHGYKELHIPPAEGGGFRLEKNALHIWPRMQFMMIALPNADGSFTCTLFWPLDGEFSFDRLSSEGHVRDFFERWFPDAVRQMPTLAEDYLAVRPSTLVTVRCRPWSHGGRVSLIGDACHAVVPFYGQGMNAAFEDCRILDECIGRHAPDWESTFHAYEELRKRHVDALAELAIANFVEMRDHVASLGFLLRKKGEKILHRLLPSWYVPLYSLVSFSHTPYADAVERSRRQGRILRGISLLFALLLLMGIVSWLWP
ncbi:MAG: FAD-dependent oxidoreductase [Planctomycetota bacterium]